MTALPWNFDIEAAPKSGRLILATKCGKVTSSKYIAEPSNG